MEELGEDQSGVLVVREEEVLPEAMAGVMVEVLLAEEPEAVLLEVPGEVMEGVLLEEDQGEAALGVQGHPVLEGPSVGTLAEEVLQEEAPGALHL